MRALERLIVVAVLGSLPATIMADAFDQCVRMRETEKDCARALAPHSDAADLKGAALNGESSIVVAVDDKGEKASLQLVTVAQGFSFAITFSAPVDEDTGAANLVGFQGTQGVVGVNNVKFEVNRINWPEFEFIRPAGAAALSQDEKDQAALEALHAMRGRACIALAEKFLAEKDCSCCAGQQGLCGKVAKLPNSAELEAFLVGGARPAKIDALEDDLDDHENGACALLRKEYGGDSDIVMLRRLLRARGLLANDTQRRAWFWGGTGTLGAKKFTYVDRNLIETGVVKTDASSREMPWSLGAKVGLIWLTKDEGKPEDTLVLSVDRAHAFKPRDPVQICTPVEGGHGLEACEDVPFGAPAAKDSLIYGLEYRRYLKKVGLAVRGFYQDFEEDSEVERDFGIEIPVFFLHNKDSNLHGGISVGWADQEDDFTISIFVGPKFSLL